MAELEDQMCAFASDGYAGEGSPDRVDALVWGLTELLVDAPPARRPPSVYRIKF